MRIVKLSVDEFADEAAFTDYLRNTIPTRPLPGLFLCGHQIAKDALDVGERLVFTLKARVIYVAKAGSNLLDNVYLQPNDYACCFQIDLKSIQSANCSLAELEQRLCRAGVEANLIGRGWNRIEDSEATERGVRSLVDG